MDNGVNVKNQGNTFGCLDLLNNVNCVCPHSQLLKQYFVGKTNNTHDIDIEISFVELEFTGL